MPAVLVGNIKDKTVSDPQMKVKYNEFSKHSIEKNNEFSICTYPAA